MAAALACAIAAPGCHADNPPATGTLTLPGATTPAATSPTVEDTRPVHLGGAEALCRPSETGFLRARLQGSIAAELDWSSPSTPQCIGGPRPAQDGLRLVYKGQAGSAPLLVIIGLGISEKVVSARNVPAGITLVREGAGEFYATQGDDKCAFDRVTQQPLPDKTRRYRLAGRGYCTQPARAVGEDLGAVLVSRFDVDAVVEYPPVDEAP